MAAPRGVTHATTRLARSRDGVITRLIYLLLFIAPQVLIYLYLRERLPDPERPNQARRVRTVLAGLFMLFNLPWLYVGQRLLFGGSLWGVGRIPFTGPWIAWQLLGWIYCALVTLYFLAKASVRGSRELGAVLFGARKDAAHRDEPLPASGP